MSGMNRAQSITDAWIAPNKCASIALSTAKKETEMLDMADIVDGFAKRLRSLRKQKNLPEEDKTVVKKLLDAFLTKKQLQSLAH